jgi:hypothetical protein
MDNYIILRNKYNFEIQRKRKPFLRREENRRKTLEARERINNKLNTHMTASPEIEPG